MYNNEDTILDKNQGNAANNESTIVDQTSGEPVVNEENGNEQKTEEKKSDKLRNIAINGGMGVAVGTLGALLMSMTLENVGEQQTEENTVETPDTPVTTDGTLPVAHSVDDSMSFGEAFNAAHEEVGPGGVFEWHGQLYNTYTAEEWNSLSPEDRQEFAAHLRVVGTTDYASNVEHHESHHEAHAEVAQANEASAHDSQQQAPQTPNGHEQTAEVHEVQTAEVVGQEDPVVEVLGVEHVTMEDGQEVTVGGVTVNGQEVVVIDMDNDGQGDVIASDLNGDGRLDENEIEDISSDPIAMSNFETGGDVDTSGEIDYLS